MNTEKPGARARYLLTGISVFGVVVLAAGVVLIMQLAGDARFGKDFVGAAHAALPGIFTAGVGVLLAVLPWVVYPLTETSSRGEGDERWRYEQMMWAMENQRQLLEAIRETSSLSDAAKLIAYRQKDREALRQAIREELERADYEAAKALVDEMERRFGYRQEAAQLREQIQAAWLAATEQQVKETIEHIEALLTRFEWNEAARQAEWLLRLSPEHPAVKRMPDRVQAARDGHKRELLKQWKDAISRDDVDRSVSLLKELDQYLTPSEAEAYKESARDVFRKRLQQMGVQFALHVHDKNWAEAIRIGRQIMDEFPNTRIAAEVREKWNILEGKGRQPAGV